MSNFIFGLFLFALAISCIAQIISYRTGTHTNPRRVALGLGLSAAVLLGVVGQLGNRALKNYFDTTEAIYVLPRKVYPDQVTALTTYSKNHPKYPVTVKSDGRDREATEYTAEIRNALADSGWDATFSTGGDGPQPEYYYGLCICATGEKFKPATDPRDFLAGALSAANIRQFSSTGGETAGNTYELFLVVGRRPVALDVVRQ